MCPNEQNQICRTGNGANPVRNKRNQTFRTGNGQILYRSTRFLLNEQVKGANLLKTSKNKHSVQEKTQSCTKREKPGVSYRKRANPVRSGEKDWQSNEAETLWHRRWPYAKASGYSWKRCMKLSWAPFALPLLPDLFALNNKRLRFEQKHDRMNKIRFSVQEKTQSCTEPDKKHDHTDAESSEWPQNWLKCGKRSQKMSNNHILCRIVDV